MPTETIKKGKIKRKVSASAVEVLHPETESDIVSYSGTIGGTTVTNVKDALDTIAGGIGVTGVKGDAESSYRAGNVNLTAANLGITTATSGTSGHASASTKDRLEIKTNNTTDVINVSTLDTTQNITGAKTFNNNLTIGLNGSAHKSYNIVFDVQGSSGITHKLYLGGPDFDSSITTVQSWYLDLPRQGSSSSHAILATSSDITTAINALDGSVTGTPSASTTLTAFSETNGVVSATFDSIQISESQVTNLTTDLGNKLDDSQLKTSWSSTVSDSNIPSEKLVKNSLDNKLDKKTTAGTYVYSHTGSTQSEIAVDTTVTQNSSNLVTSGAVWTAIDNLPEPMVFKGSVGDSGTVTWANLPAAAASNEGHTYKVITAHTADTKCPEAKVGDTIISTGSAWVVIPSGDEPSGTVTSVGLSLPSNEFTVTNSPVTSSGTLTGSWKSQAANKVFAGPASGSAAAPTFRSIVAADLPVASGTADGIVTTSDQQFLGTKSVNKLVIGDVNNVTTGGELDIKQWAGSGQYYTHHIIPRTSTGTPESTTDYYLRLPSPSGTSASSPATLAIVSDIPTESTVAGWGFTKNEGTVTSVGAGTGLSISGTASVNPTVNIASGYKLPTTTEWNNVVTLDGAQTITGVKTFTSAALIKLTGDHSTVTTVRGGTSGEQFAGLTSSGNVIAEGDLLTTNGTQFVRVLKAGKITWGITSGSGSSYELTLPNKTDTLAVLGDIPVIPSGTGGQVFGWDGSARTAQYIYGGLKADGTTEIQSTLNGATHHLELGNSGVTAGIYSAIQVNAKGIAIAGGQIVDVIANGGTPNVVNGGWYFEENAA